MALAGFKFSPSDEELVCYYLRRRIQGLPIPPCTIQDHHQSFLDPRTVDWSHTAYARDHERYYFVKRVQSAKSGSNGSKRVKRSGSDPNGFWNATKVDKKIYDHHNQVIGLVTVLNYFAYKDNFKLRKEAVKTRWNMHEYSIYDQHSFQEVVVCRIKDDARETMRQLQPQPKICDDARETMRQLQPQPKICDDAGETMSQLQPQLKICDDVAQQQQQDEDSFDIFASFLETTLLDDDDGTGAEK